MTASRTRRGRPARDEEERRAWALEADRKYNGSVKGQRRNKRYEDAHPERRLRWEPARNALRAAEGL
jgi:hypothetical protein